MSGRKSYLQGKERRLLVLAVAVDKEEDEGWSSFVADGEDGEGI